MDIKIKEVVSKKDLKTFIYLPEKIHANHKNWLHPLYEDEFIFFNREKNAMFAHNQAILFLAFKGNEAVGRIMGIISEEYNKKTNANDGRFSYFECYNDPEVFSALISAVENWAKNKGCNRMIGPMGFSDKEPQGFLTKGFDEPTMLVTNCSFAYMNDFIKGRGYEPNVELCQYDVPLNADISKRYERFTDRVARTLNVKTHEFTSRKAVKPFVKGVFDLINRSYQEIYGFTSVSDKEIEEFANRFLPILDPKLIKIITDETEKVVAFVVAMPDLSDGIRKAKGRIFPFGWFHILKAMRNSPKLMLLLGGIDPAMQNKGLDAVLATHLFKTLKNSKFTSMDSHLIMKDNFKMRREIEKLDNFRLYKEYCIYKKDI